MDFVAIDFETANREESSACALGLAIVKGGNITAKNLDSRNIITRPTGKMCLNY